MRRSKASRSTVRPLSSAISRVRSIGNPKVSCSRKAVSPASRGAVPAAASFLVSSTAMSRMLVPAASVRRKVSS
jgi:hypothetical protein